MFINHGTLLLTILIMIMVKYVTQDEKSLIIKY